MRFWALALLLVAAVAGVAAAKVTITAHATIIIAKPPGSTPFNGTACNAAPAPFLNQMLAKNYDCGGANVAFFVSNPSNPACQVTNYRPDFANLQATTDGPTYQVGCTVVGNYYKYTMMVGSPSPCPCVVNQRTAGFGGSWNLYVDGVLLVNVPTPNTGSYTAYTTASSTTFSVSPGRHTFEWLAATGDGNGNAGPMPSFQFAQAAGMACDEGPPFTGTLPAAVTNTAQFTHCALNADFNTSSTDVNGLNFSSASTFIEECGGPAPTYGFHLTYFLNQTGVNCGTHAAVINDPLGGGFKVLDLAYFLSDQQQYLNFESGCGQCGSPYTFSDTGLAWPALAQNSPGLPYELYIETTFAVPIASLNSKNPSASGSALMAPNSTAVTSQPPLGANAHLAVDQFEIVPQNTNSGAATWLWTSGLGGYNPNNNQVIESAGPNEFQDFTSYHTYGQLITSDEVKFISICSYIDGVLNHCNPGGSTGFNVQTAPTCPGGGWACYFGQNSVIFRTFNEAATCLVLQTTPCYSNDTHVYYKSIRIFTCANYKTTQCPSAIVTAENAAGTRRFAANDNSPDELVRRAVSWLRKAL